MTKEELRKEAKRRIRSIDRVAESAEIMRNLLSSPEYGKAETILAFSPLSDEPDISPLLSDERVLLPYIEGEKMLFSASRKMHRSGLGFAEPEHKEQEYGRALMLVPLLGYNKGLYRLGRGGGYYDRYIKENRYRIITLGLAFSSSFFPEMKEEDHDAKLDRIITPSGQTAAF